ncbi:S8 family serine peptidase [Streptomyces sp. NPDC086554]|uniref:S8 family serine peptidase n=1 Tax=Streptomyces sp. NPDC086554 TaxID=3154864 RepID=UPI00342D053C
MRTRTRTRTRIRTRTRLAVAIAATLLLSTACGDDRATTRSSRSSTPASTSPADFSNFDAQQAVSAPGVGILSTLPTYRTKETLKDDSGYGELDGTSMAAPYVSAVAAVRDTAKNPDDVAKLGLGIVDAKAAAAAAAVASAAVGKD